MPAVPITLSGEYDTDTSELVLTCRLPVPPPLAGVREDLWQGTPAEISLPFRVPRRNTTQPYGLFRREGEPGNLYRVDMTAAGAWGAPYLVDPATLRPPGPARLP